MLICIFREVEQSGLKWAIGTSNSSVHNAPFLEFSVLETDKSYEGSLVIEVLLLQLQFNTIDVEIRGAAEDWLESNSDTDQIRD